MKNTLLHLQYKHSGTLANRKHEELSDPPNQKICDPIIVNPCNCDPIKRHIPISPLQGSAPPGYLSLLLLGRSQTRNFGGIGHEVVWSTSNLQKCFG